MKKKITISLDNSILSRIDKNVLDWKWKNRSKVIEDILKERYWEYSDITCIIFAHDYKWDNRQYPFDIPKSLLEVRKKTIISRQVENFSQTWITNFIIIIPINSTNLFKTELVEKFPYFHFEFVEQESNLKTWEILKQALKKENTKKNLLISNWDIFYWNLKIEEFLNYHRDQKSDFSFCLKFVLNPEQLWNVQINWNKVIWFVEKPKVSEMNLTNAWLYFTSRKFLDKYDFWEYLEEDYFPKISKLGNIIWYIYSWEWEHIQNDSAFERVNWWLI